MPYFKGTFRGINTDMDVHELPSGTCRSCLNTELDGTVLRGRKGFDLFSDGPSVGETYKTIINGFVGAFANGSTYVFAKTADDKMYYSVAGSGSWTELALAGGWGFEGDDRGWFFMHADRAYFFDSSGGTKWNPVAGAASTPDTWRAGIELPRNTSSVALVAYAGAAAGGSKTGYCRVVTASRNSKTGEIGMCCEPCPAEGSLASPNQSITVGQSSDATGKKPPEARAYYEYDQLFMYCSAGTAAATSYSFEDYLLEKALATGDVSNGEALQNADAGRLQYEPLINSGGEPPGSMMGAYNGSRAVYVDVYIDAGECRPGATNFPERIMFSLPGQPTMVPQERLYDNNSHEINVKPKPWEGVIRSGFTGLPTAAAAMGERFIMCTADKTYWLIPLGSGELRPVLADPAHGAAGNAAIAETPNGVHIMGKDSWTVATREGVANIAYGQFTDVLDDVNTSHLAKIVGGYFSHRNQVWFAVPDGTSAVADRILIFDERHGALTGIWEPTNLGSAGIVAMREYSSPTAAPVMLVFLSDGNILSWPGTNYTDADVDGGTAHAYACHWEGFFAREWRANELNLKRMTLHMRDNVDDGISVKLVGLQTATSTDRSLVSKTVTRENEADYARVEYGPNLVGNIYKIRFESTEDQGANWSIAEVILDLEKVA